jgi:hypothetical protein
VTSHNPKVVSSNLTPATIAREGAQDPILWFGEMDSEKVGVVRVNSSPAVLIFGEVQSGNCEEVLL